MHGNTKLFLFLSIALAVCGFMFFVGLLLHLPFILIFILTFILAFFFLRRINKSMVKYQEGRNPFFVKELLLLYAFAFISFKGLPFAEKWGSWDAWAIWNMHAKFLLVPNGLKALTHPALAWTHPDYPLMLPGIVAFWSKVFAGDMLLVPFALALSITLIVVGLIYTEIVRRNFLAGLLVLACFAFSDYFISRGVSQLADVLLALFYTATLVCLHHFQQSKDNIHMVMTGFFLGCALWTKNEGVIFGICTCIVYAKGLFTKSNLPSFLSGIGIPFLLWLLFKVVYAPPNDLANQSINWWQRLTDSESYKMIITSFRMLLKEKFPELIAAVVLSLVFMFWSRKYFNKSWIVLLLTMVVCQASYLISPYGLEWHLGTSQDRLILQVFPAMIYVAGIGLANRINTLKVFVK